MHPIVRRILLLAAGLASAAGATAQQTWIVDGSGGGQFTEIGPAVAAAAPGDTILVRRGEYQPFVVDRGVSVLADPGTTVVHNGSVGIHVYVTRIPFGQTAVLRGLVTGGLPVGRHIQMVGCRGYVHVEAVSTDDIEVVDCTQVSFAASTMSAMIARKSTVAMSNCRLGPHQWAPLVCIDSFVVFAEGTSVGGGWVTIPGPAALVTSGELVIAGDASTMLAAGKDSLPAPAIEARGGSLVVAPTVTLVPTSGHPAISGSGEVTIRPVASLLATVSRRLLTSRLHAPGAVAAHTLVSLPPLRMMALPQPLGQFWLTPTHVVLDSGAMPPNGVRSTSLALPPLSPGALAVLQAVIVRPAQLELSTPVLLTLDL